MSIKEDYEFDLVVGIHSIASCLKNPQRQHQKLYLTEDSKKFLEQEGLNFNNVPVQISMHSPHDIQEKAKKYFKELDIEFKRVPGNAFLITNPATTYDWNWLRDEVISGKVQKILALDQVTDINNAAAILRTASFYGVGAVIMPTKGAFRLTPGFYRIASGAVEYVPIVKVSNLSKIITSSSSMGVSCVGLSEHAEKTVPSKSEVKYPLMAVLGAEETGLSHAVKRTLGDLYSLNSQGQIKSLNVSIAASIVMDRLFS